MRIRETEFILYVADQTAARDFYEAVLGFAPRLHVPGMTEFSLGEGVTLGLMPEAGIARILGDKTPHPSEGSGIPRAELYLLCEDPQSAADRAVAAGAQLIDPLADRDWGHRAVYLRDPDGHILVFAQPISS